MKRISFLLASIAALLLIANVSFANTVTLFPEGSTLGVSIDTSSIESQSGYLYFQYNQVNAADSTATITEFSGTGATLGARGLSGEGNGVDEAYLLPDDVVLSTSDDFFFTDFNQALTFGTDLYFKVLFSQPGEGGEEGGGSTFLFGLYEGIDGSGPLLSGIQFVVDWKNDGTLVTPEPSTLWLIAPVLLCMFGLRKRFCQ